MPTDLEELREPNALDQDLYRWAGGTGRLGGSMAGGPAVRREGRWYGLAGLDPWAHTWHYSTCVRYARRYASLLSSLDQVVWRAMQAAGVPPYSPAPSGGDPPACGLVGLSRAGGPGGG
jgi:hypothetical protein